MNDKLSKWLRRTNAWKFVLLMLFASYIAIFPTLLIPRSPSEIGPDIAKHHPIFQFILGVILAPILETGLFQALPIYILRKKFKFKPIPIISISAFLFGSTHWYSIRYMVLTFLIGFIFAYGYFVRRREEGHPFVLITLVHSLRNFVAFCVSIWA